MIAIDALGLSFKVHFASDSDWSPVDVVCKTLVDWIVLQRLVDEQLVVHFLLELIDDDVQPLDFFILDLAVLKQLHARSLSLLALLFDFEQLVRALLIIAFQIFALLVQCLHEVVQFADGRVLVFLLAEQLLELSHLAVDQEVLFGKPFNYLIFVLDVTVQATVLAISGPLFFNDFIQL